MKSKFALVIVALLSVSLVVSACSIPFSRALRGSGEAVTEERPVGSFSVIRLKGAGELILTQGETESLQITAEKNLLPKLSSDTVGDTLTLGFEDSFWRAALIPTRPITYTLTVVDLEKITIEGAGNLEMDGLTTASLAIELNGAGQITIDDIHADSLVVHISGTGNINLSGKAVDQTITIDGAGNVQSENLETTNTSFTINGIGNGTVWATESLNIQINGGGSVGYYGDPRVTQNIQGAGDVNALGEK